MNILNRAAMVAVVTLLAATNVAHAASWICEEGTKVREINVERSTSAAAPCSVVYDKSAEGQGSQVLWTADFDGAYCDTKADGLAEKLKSFGWTCEEF